MMGARNCSVASTAGAAHRRRPRPRAAAAGRPRSPRLRGRDRGIRVGVGGGEVDDQADHRDRLEGDAPDAEPAHLDQAGERRRRAHQQPAVPGLELHAVVGHQPGERSEPGLRRVDQRQREPRLAAAGRAADEHRAAPTSTAEACTVCVGVSIRSPAGAR